MANVTELMRNLNRAVDDTVPLIDALDLFNSALRDLAPVARIPAKVVIPVTVTDFSKPLPTNLVELRSVNVAFVGGLGSYELGELVNKYGIRVEDNKTIEWDSPFLYDGSITARYYRMPVMLAAPIDVPEIPEAFHNALVHYGAREFFAADDEPALSRDRGDKYMQMKAELAIFGMKQGVTGQPVFVDARPPWLRRR